MRTHRLNLQCTVKRHEQIGVHAVINAAAGMAHVNQPSDEDWRMIRDQRSIQDRLIRRVRFYQFESKACRKRPELQKLISRHDD